MELVIFLIIGGAILLYYWPKPPKNNSRDRNRASLRPSALPSRVRPTPELGNLPSIPPNLTITGKAHIIDGDTIKIGKTKIRLAGIDAPEINMPWGQKSKWAMVEICKGQVITARLDGERSFDRLVGTCFLPDGRDIGAEIIKKGLALDLPHFSGGKYRQYEPVGARKKLCNGRFGHSSLKSNQYADAYRRNNS